MGRENKNSFSGKYIAARSGTPLNAIVGFAGLLGTASDQDRISYVEIIKGEHEYVITVGKMIFGYVKRLRRVFGIYLYRCGC